jgi:hypothetical protein
MAGKLLYEESSTGVGSGGGVVIQELDPDNGEVRYYFTDIIVLELIARGFYA